MILTFGMVMYILKKEGIKITISFSESYNNAPLTIIGN